MNEELVQDEKLSKEYDEVFSGDEKEADILKITRDKFTIEKRTIKISDIVISEPVKQGRKTTLSGLSKSIEELGVLTPIHVMDISKGDIPMFSLLDGTRRLFGAVKNGIKEIDANVWVFEDIEIGKKLALTLHLILNRNQDRRWSEIWELYQILELQMNITPGSLEYLLQLQSGDAMKLKDVMLCDYSEVQEALLSGEKDLEGSYRLLQKLRKEEDQLAKDDATGITDTAEDGGEIVDNTSGSTEDDVQLSEDDVRELLDMADSSIDDTLGDSDFSEMNTSAFEDEGQKVGERHPVDPAIKQATFQRDNYRCRCCNTGGAAFLSALVYHHLIPVHAHGKDTVENGLTICDSCHLTLHCSERAGGKIPMTKEQFEEYSDADKARIKKIIKFSKIAVEAQLRLGRSKKEISDASRKSSRHRMPGEGLKETQQGFAQYSNQ